MEVGFHSLVFGDPGDALSDHIGVDWFEQVVRHAMFEGRDRSFHVGKAGDDDEFSVRQSIGEIGQMVFHFTVWQAAVEDGQMDVWLNLGVQDFGEAAGDANDVTVQFQDVDHVR